MKRTAIIMAGGTGERFWPLSRKLHPKQLLTLASDKTMLEEAIERIEPLVDKEDIYIVTSVQLLQAIRDTLIDFPPQNVIAEPMKRNTAPCLALGAAFIKAKYKGLAASDISISVLTADHNISPTVGFIKTISKVLDTVENENCISVLGIEPNRPETGFGYIEVNNRFECNDIVEIKHVLAFREKPSVEIAKAYVESGLYMWNSGMFFWRLDTFCDQMIKHLPEVGLKINDMTLLYEDNTNEVLHTAFQPIINIFELFPNVSIDYGLMEKADDIVVARACFDWDDLGSWDSLERTKQKDDNGNIIEGNVLTNDTHNSILINTSKSHTIKFVGIGLNEFVVVVCDDAVLVMPKDRSQDLRNSVNELKKTGSEKWL